MGPFMRTCGTILHLSPTCGTQRLVCHVYLWDLPTCGTQRLTCHMFMWDLLCRQGQINSKKYRHCLGIESRTRRKQCTAFSIALHAWLCSTCVWSRYTSTLHPLCGCPIGWSILDISPSSGNKYVPVRLAAAATADNPHCVVVAPASYWRLGGGAC
jgi:hypothetical protein